MSSGSQERVNKSFKNARVAVTINVVLLLLSFWSRRIFIDILGTSVTGMNSTLIDLLGLLNLAELGVLTAISYSLYKPLFDGDRQKISQIISLMGYLYRIIGAVILGAGVVVSLFLPILYGDKGVDLILIFVGFYTLLVTNLLSYFFNYKQNILAADHSNYVIVSTTGMMQVGKTVLQILFLSYIGEGLYVKYFEFLAIELLFSVCYTVVINKRVKSRYPWLDSSYATGRRVRKDYPEVFLKIKQVFAHKFAGFVLTQTDTIIISIILSWSTVTLYTNYQLIFSRLTRLVFASFDNLNAGIGGLVAQGDKQKVQWTYYQLNALFFWVAGVVVLSGYFLTEPFIRLWLGQGGEFVLSKPIFVVFMANLYVSIVRRPQDVFLGAHGIFHDVWAPWVEAALNLIISIVMGLWLGLIGVLVGTLISTFLIAGLWKPYLLFKEAFGLSMWRYWRQTVVFLGLTFVSCVGMFFVNRFFDGAPANYYQWIVRAVVLTSGSALLLGGLMYLSDGGMRQITNRILGRWMAKLHLK